MAKLERATRAFSDTEDIVGHLPIELTGRRFIRASKRGVTARCVKPGNVIAITSSAEAQVKALAEHGFRRLDFPEFQAFANDPASKALAFQKPLKPGETLALPGWVLLSFGPEERGGIPFSRMRSLDPPVFLPDGSEFRTWEVPQHYSKTLYVDQAHPKALDTNPGTREMPLKTINRAAQLLQPGERVVVQAGVYREWVRPVRGGTDPEHMISYEAAPGARVVIKGSEILKTKWRRSYQWGHKSPMGDGRIWMVQLPGEMFKGYNPFGVTNYPQVDDAPYWKLGDVFADARAPIYLQVRGLVFQNGRRLKQVSHVSDLEKQEGVFWVEAHGLTIHVAPYDGADPNDAEWEITTREQIFAPEEYFLGFIRVKGFVMEHAANGFPFPQRGAISTMHGHHWVIENNTVQWANGVGIDIGDQGGPGATPAPRPAVIGYQVVRGNELNDIGVTGLTGPGPYGSLIEDNVFRRNAWHDAEMIAEAAAVKTHHNLGVVMRRNLVIDTMHGTGLYMDVNTSNSRITQNAVINTGSLHGPGPGIGGIYVEGSLFPTLVDNNFVWGSTKTNGIYCFFISKVTIANNFVGNCANAGIMVMDVPGRRLGARTVPSGSNTVLNNILVGNGWHLGFHSSENRADHNIFGSARKSGPFRMMAPDEKISGDTVELFRIHLDMREWRSRYGFDQRSAPADVTAEFNPQTLQLDWAVRGADVGIPVHAVDRDFWGRSRAGGRATAGPFGQIAGQITRVVVDPRVKRK